MIYSAGAIRWIPQEIAPAKTFELLKPGGVLAMVLTASEYRPQNESLHEKIRALFDYSFLLIYSFKYGNAILILPYAVLDAKTPLFSSVSQ